MIYIALETSLSELNKKLDGDNEIHVKLARFSGDVKTVLGSMPSVEKVQDFGSGEYIVKSKDSSNIGDELAKVILANNWGLKELKTKSNTLEDVFLNVIASDQKQ